MSILTVTHVAKSYVTDLLFSHVNFSIAAGQKMGLVGRNGCGKTTLLRILLGQETSDASPVQSTDGIKMIPGRVSLAAGRRLGYLRQEAPVHPEHTIWEEAQSVYAPLREMAAQMQALETAMSEAATDEVLERVMADYAKTQEAFEAAGGYQDEGRLEFVLQKLGFREQDYTKLVGSCSGGEQTRLALAKIVLSRPDLLILDEPTNHLDIDATEWLEGFLKSYEGAVLVVSHDRYFLDAVCDTIGELENQRLTLFRGNYAQFRAQREAQTDHQQALYDQQQTEIARLQAIIKRNMGADSIQSALRHRTEGRIARMEKVERPTSDTSTVKAKIDAEAAGRVGREVVRFDHLSKTFGDRTLLQNLNALVERGDRVGLVGPNGAGKTTLVRMILGTEQPTLGTITLGHNARISYFSQHAADSLNPELSVYDSILDVVDFTETETRNYLARFLFTGDDVYKQVSMLSGGEKNKLALARMIIEPCNLLILDEPTNHLDITSCETLTTMLADYAGTLLLVSHDRYLLNAVTTKTLGLTGAGGAAFVEGNYAAWREMQIAQTSASAKNGQGAKKASAPMTPITAKAAVAPSSAPSVQNGKTLVEPPPGMNFRELSKARTKARETVVKAEAAVQSLEDRLGEVETGLAQTSGTVQNLVSLAAEHTRLQDDLADALARWELAVAEQEALGV